LARRTFPRSQAHHERKAAEVLQRHAAKTGWTPSLPVPIELIIEETYGLRIETWAMEDPPGRRLLGALFQNDPAIVINERHARLFERVIGPFEFTVAHELAHWLYDADAGQGALFDTAREILCHDPELLDPSDTARIRELNANKFAAALLMPADLVRRTDVADLISHHREYAVRWGVSARALEIRLSELRIVTPGPLTRPHLGF
jgi:Zn-dependent peptidase ImmA (M78 family)